MITEKDLQEAIAECQGQKNPNANTCLKLASYYIIQDRLRGEQRYESGYSYAPQAEVVERVEYLNDSDFSRAVHGKDLESVFPVIDEIMSTVQVLYPRLYDSAIQKLRKID